MFHGAQYKRERGECEKPRSEAFENKPALKLDFNHYASGQSFLGLKALVLDNLVQDPSGVHESTSMWFFARLGVPAPRESHPMVYVNGEYSGVYSIVEPIDKSPIARVFGKSVRLINEKPAGELLESEIRSELDVINTARLADTRRPHADTEYLARATI